MDNITTKNLEMFMCHPLSFALDEMFSNDSKWAKETGKRFNEKWNPVSESSEEWKKICGLIEKVKKSHEEVDSNFELNYVAKQGSGLRISLCGGMNGGGDWNNYLDTIKDVFKALTGIEIGGEEYGSPYLIEATDDCIDDVYYVIIGLMPKRTQD